MDFIKFFRRKKIEDLNDSEFKLDKDSVKQNVEFNEPEFNSDLIRNVDELKNNKKTLKKLSKTTKNDQNLDENNKKNLKKHYEGHRKRLKEKILNNDIEQIMDYELLEGLIMYAIPRNDVKPLAKSLLEKFKTLKNIFLAPNNQIASVNGIGDGTLCFFKILNEIYCRFGKMEVMEEISLNSPDKVAIYCQARMGHLKHEQFRVLFLNKKNRLIKDLVLQNGTIDRAAIFPRELVLKALEIGAGGLILVHNHPSGDPAPSKADIDITQEIKQAANLMDILVYDHLIVAKKAYYSMKAHRIF